MINIIYKSQLRQKGAAKNDKHHIWMISYHGGKLPIILNGGRVIVVPQLVGDHLVVGFSIQERKYIYVGILANCTFAFIILI